ncbi:MAG: hypothetical protein ACREOZ_02705, partial [Gloeomargaritales cyanobacterium]
MLPALKKSFAEEEASSFDELRTIACHWAFAEDDLDCQQAEIEEAIEQMEMFRDEEMKDGIRSDDEGDGETESKSVDAMVLSASNSADESGFATWTEFHQAFAWGQKFLV